MSNCVDCQSECFQIVSTKCIRSEQKLTKEYKTFDELLKNFDDSIKEVKDILESKIDKKWIKKDHSNIVGYLQEVINKIGVLSEGKEEEKLIINTTLVKGEKTFSELFSILFKEIEALKKQDQSPLYIR